MGMLFSPTRLDFCAEGDRPVFYQAGPIRGAGDWQLPAARWLMRRMPKAIICSPCRYPAGHPLLKRPITSLLKPYDRQTDWEDVGMKYAARYAINGCLIFWLPRESRVAPRAKKDGPYAQDTYGELGYWRRCIEEQRSLAVAQRDLRIVIGAEEGFPGLRGGPSALPPAFGGGRGSGNIPAAFGKRDKKKK